MLALFSTYFFLLISPGPNFALVTALAVQGKKKESIFAILGFSVATLTHAALALSGVSYLTSNFPSIKNIIFFLSGIYLLYIGLGMLAAPKPENSDSDVNYKRSGSHFFWSGFIVDFTNPKGVVFFVGLFSAFLPSEVSLVGIFSILTVFFALEFLWYYSVVMFFSSDSLKKTLSRFSYFSEKFVGAFISFVGVSLSYKSALWLMSYFT